MLMIVPSQDTRLFAGEIRRMLAAAGGIGQSRTVMDAGAEYDAATWRSLAQLDIAGLLVAADRGGTGAELDTAVAIAAETGRVLLPGPFWSSAVVSAAVLGACGTAEADELLPGLATGRSVITTALIDGSAGWSPSAVSVQASGDGDACRLTGTSPFVTDAASSDVMLVPAATGDGIALYALARERARDKMSVTTLACLDASRPLSRVEFDDCPARLIATGGTAEAAVRRGFALGALMLVAAGVGAADRCLEMTLDYARSRVQFGHVIGSYQAIKHRCADMFIRIESVRSAVCHTAAVLSDPGADERAAAVAVHSLLAIGPERLLQCAGDTIQIHGGVGFTWEHDAHLYFKRAQADAKLLGEAVAHRGILARCLGVLQVA